MVSGDIRACRRDHNQTQVCGAFQNSGILPLIFLNAMFRGSPELLSRGVAYVRCVATYSGGSVRCANILVKGRFAWCGGTSICGWVLVLLVVAVVVVVRRLLLCHLS